MKALKASYSFIKSSVQTCPCDVPSDVEQKQLKSNLTLQIFKSWIKFIENQTTLGKKCVFLQGVDSKDIQGSYLLEKSFWIAHFV